MTIVTTNGAGAIADGRYTLAYPDPLAAIREVAAHYPAGGDDDPVLEMCIGAGIQDLEDMDGRRWRLGDIAVLLQDRYPTYRDSYGKRIVDHYAREIKARARTLFEYAETARFYPDSARRALSATYPNLVYSQFRTAMRSVAPALRRQDPNSARAIALEFLMKCGENDWTADMADREARRPKSSPAWSGIREALVHKGGVYFWIGTDSDLVPGVMYRLSITEID